MIQEDESLGVHSKFIYEVRPSEVEILLLHGRERNICLCNFLSPGLEISIQSEHSRPEFGFDGSY